MLVDTHAHLHFDDYSGNLDQVIENARRNGIRKIINVGVKASDSAKAIEFSKKYQNSSVQFFATSGLHPHDSTKDKNDLIKIKELTENKQIVAIGECGLDYYKNFSSKTDQRKALVFQLELALTHNLPLVFHVREAFNDFFEIIKDYPFTRGVLHSFSAYEREVELALKYNLFFGLNGIMTFTKDNSQLEAAKLIPDNKLLLETDCPFLSPEPFRGKRNEPANTKIIAEFLAQLRGQSFEKLSSITTKNAIKLFGI